MKMNEENEKGFNDIKWFEDENGFTTCSDEDFEIFLKLIETGEIYCYGSIEMDWDKERSNLKR